jgi:hypothetical protein
MPRFLQLLLVLAAFMAGIWFLYAGYGRGVSLAGKTTTGFAQLKTGLDGKTRIPTHHLMYAAGFTLILGSTWWLVKGGDRPKGRRRR